MQQIQRFSLGTPSDHDLYNAAVTGDWSKCAGATAEDLMRLLAQPTEYPPPATAAYMAFEAGRLHQVPDHLLTGEVIASLWELPVYSNRIQREFELGGESGEWGYLEPLLLTAENACQSVNERGETCLHIAARFQKLHRVPKQMLTLRGLCAPDRTARTPMALADQTDLDQLRAILR